MKKILLITIISLSLMLVGSGLFAQDPVFEIKAVENDMGYLEVQMRETSGNGTPTTAIPIAQITFEIRWANTSTADVEILCTSNHYTIGDGLGEKKTKDSYFWRNFVKTQASPVYVATNWVQNEWEIIATFKVTGATGVVDFEIAPVGWVPQDLVWTQGNPAVPYFPTPNGSASNYSYPTLVYNYVWTGAAGGPPPQHNANKWENAGNWRGTCSNDDPPENTYPYLGQTGSYVLIPDDLTNYPELSTNVDGWGWACNKMFIQSGAHVTVPDLAASNPTNPKLFVDGSLKIDGTLNLPAKGYATVTGTTTINSATGIVVEATSEGIGSFIDNGTIAYGASGSAKVQTYLTNSAGVGNLDIHQVGTTVDMIGGGAGSNLSAFNLVNGNTYAYDWDETVGFSTGWTNIFSGTYVVSPGAGIGLSTDDGSTNTLEMTGALFTGNISSPALTFSNNHNELLSNPYPSAIDFDGLAGDNSSVVQNKYWIWNPAANTYVTRAGGIGGPQYIQVGQGFFVEMKQAGTFNFTNARRTHSADAFRSTVANLLSVKVVGGLEGYTDETFIRFDDDATSGYDIEIEAEKWSSQNSDATMISTIAEDNTELAINVLSTESLLSGMTSVPMNFNCGYSTEYTLSFFDIESFEVGTEIWLEDKQTGDDWISINDNPDYTFTATPDDLEDRFVIHFFGPTGVNEFSVDKTVDIFSYRQNAFVRNNTNEVIKTVNIYTLAGELLQTNKPDNIIKLNSYWVSDNVGYFVVRVITDKNVYTGKVFISK